MMRNPVMFYYAIGICIIMGITLVFMAQGAPAAPASNDMCETALCEQYLKSLGYENGGMLEQVPIVIPVVFDKVYQNYNDLQKKAGMNLKPYRGRRVTRYTYSVTNFADNIEGVRANLLCYDGKIIGGDLSTVAINGFMVPLLPKKI